MKTKNSLLTALVLIIIMLISGCSSNVDDTASSDVANSEPKDLIVQESTEIISSPKLLPSIKKSTYTMAKDDDIASPILDEMKRLEDIILESLKTNNENLIVDISCSELKQNTANLKSFATQINQFIGKSKVDSFARYHCTIDTTKNIGSQIIDVTGENEFILHFGELTGEVCVSLLKLEFKGNEKLISSILTKEDDGWQLYMIYFNNYSYYGMNAIDLYNKSKALAEEGSIVPAVLIMSACSNVLRPAPFLQYNGQMEIMDFYKDLMSKVQKEYTLPKEIKTSTGSVELYGLNIEMTTKGFMPDIRYVTQLDLGKDNEANLKKEANEIHNDVMGMFNGLEENFDVFLYRAYSELPIDPQKKYNGYGTVIEK